MANEPKKRTPYVSDTTSMKIDLIGDTFIDANIKMLDLQPVTNPQRFEKGSIPTADGLFSPYIFGHTPEERRTQFAYIDLHCKVFHPYAYEVIKRMWSKIDKVASGEGSWEIDTEGNISEVPDGDPDNTGMDWLVENFRKIVFKTTGSHIRDERMKLIDSLKDDELFISKWLVIPVFYRDVQIIGGTQNIPPINKNYTKLIQYANSVIKDPYFSNIAKYNIQMQLVTIRQYGQTLVEKKREVFKRSVLGKTIDYGFRSVISVFHIDSADKPEENPIDIFHTGVPLAQCCVLFYPFIKRYVSEFIRQTVESMGDRYPVYDEKENKIVNYLNFKDPLSYYNSDKIQEIIDQFIGTPATRFRPVELPVDLDGTTAMLPIHFSGHGKNEKIKDIKTPQLYNRVLTWTDLLYMAAVDTLYDKHVYITRYPLEDYFGTFPSRVFVLSTMKTMPMIYNERNYPFYPQIDPSLPEAEVSTLFNDTVTMDNTYLKGLGGDYDGDQVSLKGIFSAEANAEAEEIMHSIKHYVNIAGDLMRVIGNEAFLTYYNMTKD